MLHRHYPAFGKACFCILFALFLLVGGICKGQPKITVAITNPTCAYNNGGFVVSVTGGTPPYGFVSNAAHIGNTTGVFGGLAAGSYDLTVTDGKGKQDTTTVVLTGPGTFPYFTSSVVNATGCNANNGQVTLTPAGGTPPYQYSINDGASFQTSNIFGNLSPGTYSILIEDANGCITAPWSAVGESYANFQLWSHASFVHVAAANCPLSINATPSAPACGNNNSITISNTSGGTPPYLYSIDGGAAGPLSGGGFSGLAPGQHTVTVRDASGLVASYTYTFPNDCPITTTETPSDCAGSTGTLTVTAASGIPPLTYSINGVNFQAGNTFNNLAAGTYTVLARDAHGAVTYGFGTVVAVCFGANASTSPSQCDASTGSITAKGIHGFPPYTYSIDGVHFQASGVFSNLKGGYYQVTVKDSHGQKAATTAVVDDQCITLAANPQTASCGKANGTLTVTAGGGTEPYKYSIYAGSYYQKSNVFTGLLPGYYVVTVADANGNLATIASVVTNIEGPQVSAVPTAASCLNNDGQIQVLTTGGASPFMVNFDGRGYYDGQTRWTGLPKGVYSVAVMDNNGCQDSTTVLVALDDTMAVTTDSVPTICQGVAVALPAKSNYNGVSFAWTPSQGLNDDHLAEPVATPSTTTTYTVTATLGACSHADSIAVTVIPAPVATTGPPDT
ncbi:MAG TPA: SprB repeat-containing protein, partial [Puia sp.]|nr:SprB repeat-containing protein [Puia sp.]